MASRPDRLRLPDELGRMKSLPAGEEHFRVLGRGRRVVFLGLGPDPLAWPGRAFSGRPVGYVEDPVFAAAAAEKLGYGVPSEFEALEPEAVDAALAGSAEFRVYEPGVRLRPGFWGPMLGRVRAALLGCGPEAAEVWIPARPGSLLTDELARGFEAAGLKARLLDAEKSPAEVPELLADSRPRLYFSVNFQGLDVHGELFHLLEAAGADVAVWCVDNPFHLLTAQRSAWWTRAALFVTDSFFMDHLRAHGAGRVFHLPLAADPAFADRAGQGREPNLADRLVFVGRSAFPNKEKYFAGCRAEPGVLARGLGMLGRGGRPDFAWWARELELRDWWPGNEVRRAGFGAETCARAWRTLCLEEAARVPLAVYGDEGWAEAVPGLEDLRPEVDYYGPLAGIYASAGACLNVTSLLLPSGLTQRHFDVWAAGGLLMTDATPGLDIFPPGLVREIRFGPAREIPELFNRLQKDAALASDLKKAWQTEITSHHTYAVRTATALEALSIRV